MGYLARLVEGRYCLIGEDVSASPSPSMMNAAFSQLGIKERYFALSLERKDDELVSAFDRLKSAGIKGLNVTIPFKTSIIPLLDGLDHTARRVGAVNVVKETEGRFLGHNSDVDGILGPLRKTDLRRGRVVLLGAGGAARAFVEAMRRSGCRTIIVMVREPSRASSFLAEMGQAYPEIDIALCSFEQSSTIPNGVTLLFNGTPAGSPGRPMPSQVFRLIGPETIVFDAVYRPVGTELIHAATALGCRVIHGYEMLLNQGVVAFELWTGRKAPIEVMEQAILNHLAEIGS